MACGLVSRFTVCEYVCVLTSRGEQECGLWLANAKTRRPTGTSAPLSTMLDSLALLLEKAFLLAHFDIFSVLLSGEKDRKVENAAEVERERRLQQQRLRRGDLLEVPRTLFIHFGIYLGDGKVAHLIPDILPALTSDERRIGRVVSNKRLLLGVLYKCATIRVDTLEDFAYGSPVLLNTMDDALRTRPLANEEVALRAEKLIGRIPYSLLWNNCEHFVTYCRYGTAVSSGHPLRHMDGIVIPSFQSQGQFPNLQPTTAHSVKITALNRLL